MKDFDPGDAKAVMRVARFGHKFGEKPAKVQGIGRREFLGGRVLVNWTCARRA